jgi:hypothetical protein
MVEGRITAGLRCHRYDCLLRRSGHTPGKQDADCCIEDGFVYKNRQRYPGTGGTLHNCARRCPEIFVFLYL